MTSSSTTITWKSATKLSMLTMRDKIAKQRSMELLAMSTRFTVHKHEFYFSLHSLKEGIVLKVDLNAFMDGVHRIMFDFDIQWAEANKLKSFSNNTLDAQNSSLTFDSFIDAKEFIKYDSFTFHIEVTAFTSFDHQNEVILTTKPNHHTSNENYQIIHQTPSNQPTVFKEGDYVLYNDMLCTVQCVKRGFLSFIGPVTVTVEAVCTGDSYETQMEHLQTPSVDDLEALGDQKPDKETGRNVAQLASKSFIMKASNSFVMKAPKPDRMIQIAAKRMKILRSEKKQVKVNRKRKRKRRHSFGPGCLQKKTWKDSPFPRQRRKRMCNSNKENEDSNRLGLIEEDTNAAIDADEMKDMKRNVENGVSVLKKECKQQSVLQSAPPKKKRRLNKKQKSKRGLVRRVSNFFEFNMG
eukprot:1065157_1